MPLHDALRLDDRLVVVTGAARGIGAAVARAVAELGARPVLWDRDSDDLRAVAAACREGGAEVTEAVLDVRDEAALADALADAVDRGGSIGGIVNNAGGGFASPFTDLSANAVDALVRENFTSAATLLRLAGPHLARGASVVNVTSVEAHRAGPGFAVYSAMKAALTNLTASLALEWGHRGIRVNAVAPDVITTPGVGPMGVRAPLAVEGRPEHVAAVVAFLLSDLAGFVSGGVVHVDGGTAAAGGWWRDEDGSFRAAASLHSPSSTGQ